MKKKGLIISTVVMVVVLIAALTTATYAWFTTTNKTTISGFNLQVVASNALNIGVKNNLSAAYSADDTSTAFRSGTCTFSNATDGSLNSGTWDGDDGLGATLDHQIVFGDMDRAVGFVAASETVANGMLSEKATVMPSDPSTSQIIIANKGEGATLSNVELAKANNDSEGGNADYAYLWLGVSPNKALAEGAKLHVFVQSVGGGNNIGIAAAVHVAYRVNNATEGWTDVDAFAQKGGTAHTYASTKASAKVKLPVDTDEFGKKDTEVQGMADVSIGLTAKEVGVMDQVQLVIYLAGADSDCVDAAKGVSAKIGIYFETKDAEATAEPTATIDGTGKLTVTGVNGAKVEYQVNDGAWIEITTATWSSNTLTYTIPNYKNTDTIKVRQTETGKSASIAVTATKA